MKYINKLKNTTISLILLLVLISACTQNPREKANSLFIEKKYDLAIAQLNIAIEKQPDKIWSIADTCFLEGAKLLNSGNHKDADLLYNYAINLIQKHSLALPVNFFTYINAININDSIFKKVSKLIPTSSYSDLATLLMKLNPADAKVYPAYCLEIPNGYSSDLWLIPSDTSRKTNKNAFGLPDFNPIASYILTNTQLDQINSISPKAFIRSVQSNYMFLTEYMTNGLCFSLIPELYDVFNQLKSKNDLQIAAEKDKIINQIVKIREEYLIANLKFIYTKFEISGKCYAYRNNYNIDSKEIDLHLSLDSQTGGIYIATIRTPLSLDDAQKLFEIEQNITTTVKIKVSPGVSRKGLGIAGGGVSRWVMPNLYLFENPIIVIKNSNGFELKIKADGLQGELWPSDLNTQRWDRNAVDSPELGQYGNARIVIGTKI